MDQITKESLEKALSKLPSKKDLERLVTKEDLVSLEQRINIKLDAMIQLLDVRHRVERLEEQVAQLKLQAR